MRRCATVYAARTIGLCIFIGVLLISPSHSSGNLGCRFSPVCSAREVCREDKLFGTCARRSASVYAYDLDPAGYIQLKNAIEYLLSRGYSWHNSFAQHSLKIVLKPYRHEVDLYSDRMSPLIPNDSEFSSTGMNVLLNDLELLELLENEEEYTNNNLRGSDAYASRNKPHKQKPVKRPPYRHKTKTAVPNRMADALQQMYYEKYLEYLEKVAEEEQEEAMKIYEEFNINQANNKQQWDTNFEEQPNDNQQLETNFEEQPNNKQQWDTNFEEQPNDKRQWDSNFEEQPNDNQQWDTNFEGGKEDIWGFVTDEDAQKNELPNEDGNEVVKDNERTEIDQNFNVYKDNKDEDGFFSDGVSSDKTSFSTQDYIDELSLNNIESVMEELHKIFSAFDPKWWLQLSESEKSRLLDQALLMLLESYPSLTPKPLNSAEYLENLGTVWENENVASDAIEFSGEEEEIESQSNLTGDGFVIPEAENEPVYSETLPKPTDSSSNEVVQPVNKEVKDINTIKEDIEDVNAKEGIKDVNVKEEGIKDVNMEKKEHDVFDVHNNLAVDTTVNAAVTSKPSKKDDKVKNRVFIITNETLEEKDGENVVHQLSEMLELPEDAFTDIKVKNKRVTFNVNSKYNNSASEVASKAAQLGVKLHKRLGPTIRMTGSGSGLSSEIHTPQVEKSDNHNPTLIILTLILVGCVLGVLLAVIAIFCYRQKVKTRDKLKNIATGSVSDKEATVDYQDLCRQRMACKNAEKPEPLSRMSSVGHSDTAQPSPSRSSRSSTSSWSEEPVQTNMDISTGHLVLTYMEDHMRNKDRLTDEWNALSEYEAEPNIASVGKLPENLSKNRFEDVIPYDHTRVILKESSDPSHSDYVNASVITDSDPRAPAYICTQAPLAHTMSDFWEMIWEQGVVVIVNLTRPAENDIVQCEKYWPEEETKAYNNYEVHLVSEHVWCDDYLVRSFYLKNLLTNETRTVTQFHYLTWPDNGIPASPRPLLEFRRKVNKSYRGRCCPIVVHCSDGIGRTGTYCLIDMTLTRMIKGAKEIDLAATLEHVRDQRPGMVRTKEQFEFVLTAVAEEVNAILKAIPQ